MRSICREVDTLTCSRRVCTRGWRDDDGRCGSVLYRRADRQKPSGGEAVRTERGKVKSCRIHDLLRDVAIKKANEVNFVHIYNDQLSSTTCRREVVHHHMDPYSCDRRVNKRMRSFLFFGERNRTLWGSVKPITLKLELLRVLHLEGLHFPDVIGELIHLRYLGIADTFISNLPVFISNLRFLQTLDASGNDSFRKVTDLRRLTSLRHLMGRFVGDLLIGDAVNLQTLDQTETRVAHKSSGVGDLRLRVGG